MDFGHEAVAQHAAHNLAGAHVEVVVADGADAAVDVHLDGPRLWCRTSNQLNLPTCT